MTDDQIMDIATAHMPTLHSKLDKKDWSSLLSAMREAVQKGSIEFSKWKDDNCRDCGSGDEWTIGATGKIYTTEQLYQEYKKLNP